MSQSNTKHFRRAKCVSQPLSANVETLELLDIRPDGIKGPATKNPQTLLPYKQIEIANRVGVTPGVFSTRRKRATEFFAHGAESASSKRVCRISARNFPQLEDALCHYMQQFMSFVSMESILRVTEGIPKALDLNEEMLVKVKRKLDLAVPGSDVFQKR